jgi:hypothetical protein
MKEKLESCNTGKFHFQVSSWRCHKFRLVISIVLHVDSLVPLITVSLKDYIEITFGVKQGAREHLILFVDPFPS